MPPSSSLLTPLSSSHIPTRLYITSTYKCLLVLPILNSVKFYLILAYNVDIVICNTKVKQWVIVLMHLHLGDLSDISIKNELHSLVATLTPQNSYLSLQKPLPENMIHAARPHSSPETAVHLSVGRL